MTSLGSTMSYYFDGFNALPPLGLLGTIEIIRLFNSSWHSLATEGDEL